MAKILVADDNSNIQKMVGLALKDQGIDVVAVGNGEAAVRKISDVRPDLVLADVFMPVRNGYEVCNYVKQDSALSHIPVILLVGAFDPLDEQEAQRVGADGVLKKPFVPPDPLISMVKSALTRAGVVLGAAEPAPPPPMATTRAEPPPLPRVAPPPPPPPPATTNDAEQDLGLLSVSSRPTPLTIDKGEQPLAFGSLLDSTAQEESVFTTSSGNTSAPERDWGQSEAQEADEPEEEGAKSGWRLNSLPETSDEAPAGQTDWREAAFAGVETDKAHKQWSPTVDKHSLSITEEEAAQLAKQQTLEVPAGVEDWSKAIRSVFPEKHEPAAEPPRAAAEEQTAAPAVEPARVSQEAEPPAREPETAAVETPPAGETNAAPNSWMAGAVSPWEAELQRANDLSATWDSIKIAGTVPEDTSATEAFLDSGLMTTAHEHVVEAIEEAKGAGPVAREHAETAEQAAAESFYSSSEHQEEPTVASASGALEVSAPQTAESTPEATSFAAETAAAPAINGNMDELVAKVLAKMNPEVLQAVTREILKPVVEALVKDELSKK